MVLAYPKRIRNLDYYKIKFKMNETEISTYAIN